MIAVERAMCEAVPGVTPGIGRVSRPCARVALEVVSYRGEDRHVCGLHQVAWLKKTPAERDADARRWGWTS